MIQSFYTGNAGLSANREWLSVISDNIANVNTIGFKAERANFEDLISKSLTTFANGSPKNFEIGGGSFVGSTTKDFSQGSLMNTNTPTDLALDGEGFFMVQDNQGLTYYTRAGQFRTNANGDLVNLNGQKLLGWALDRNGNISGSIKEINIPNSMAPSQTTQITFKEPTNLDSRVNVISAPFNPGDSTTFNYVNSFTTYDSLGNPHTTSYYFQRVGTNTWAVYKLIDGTISPVDVGGTLYKSVKLTFNPDGTLNVNNVYVDTQVTLASNETQTDTTDGYFTLANLPVRGSVHIKSYTTGGTPYVVNWHDDGAGNIVDENGNSIGTIDYGTGTIRIYLLENGLTTDQITVDYLHSETAVAPVNVDPTQVTFSGYDPNNGALIPLTTTENFKEIRQVASDFIFYAQQDGYAKGDLLSVAVSEDGVVKGVYSNGQVRDLARIAIATFKDKEILVRKGNNLYLPNSQTYTPIIVPGGVISKIRSGFLELSNVDISREFINLITAQRAYQANARTITTSDQVLQETMNIKR
ncbi:flagellar hook protein FlgE [Persephonella atlantica]|uniref:Flagellar hook protein FlgE n=1 Tax=Persephonella atlantica TaxID=2699429 RepID=A0ABS1GI05_9AQUI|nr:flagellar hook protein FlgE [Persephonella atlantica]MBK3332466.1 flagellar hook protein FlgE [Persephonella atlantica]